MGEKEKRQQAYGFTCETEEGQRKAVVYIIGQGTVHSDSLLHLLETEMKATGWSVEEDFPADFLLAALLSAAPVMVESEQLGDAVLQVTQAVAEHQNSSAVKQVMLNPMQGRIVPLSHPP